MNGHNPDILTCLANLSADEVFTPPKLASAMLDILPQDLFRRPDTTFLDPVCKSGVFLREIAGRLNDGLRDQMPDTQSRINHILTKQVFGLAITALSSARFLAYFLTIAARFVSRSIMLVLAMSYFLNGKLKASSRARPCSSFFAVVPMVMFMPRRASTFSYSISGKMICSVMPKL